MSTYKKKFKAMTVYCGSWFGKSPKYRAAAEQFGRELAKNGITLVYGGGLFGMMGAMAKEAHDNGGKIIAITTRIIRERERSAEFANEMTGPPIEIKAVEPLFVANLFERKKRLIGKGDVLCALPGSTGTLDELYEAIVLRHVGIIKKPIIILNLDGYYDLLQRQIELAVQEGFTSEKIFASYRMVATVDEIIPTARKMLEG